MESDDHLMIDLEDEDGIVSIESEEEKQKRLATKQWEPKDIFYKESENTWDSKFPDQVNHLYMQLKQQRQLTTAAQNLSAAIEQMKLQRDEEWALMNDQQRRAFKVKERMLRNKRDREQKKENEYGVGTTVQ